MEERQLAEQLWMHKASMLCLESAREEKTISSLQGKDLAKTESLGEDRKALEMAGEVQSILPAHPSSHIW